MDARFPAGLRIPTHTHEGACVSVVLDGEFSERLLGDERYCSRGTVLAKSPFEAHDDAFGRFGSRQLIVEVAPGALDATCERGRPWDDVVHAHAAEAETMARGLVRELAIADSASPLAIEGLSLELLACVWRLQRRHTRRCPPAWLRHAREFLADQFQASPTLEQVAEAAGVHPAHLAREFRAHFGESIGHYLRRMRVDWSKTQLLATREALARIALRAGFADQSHFTRWFKRETGMTPHRYRLARVRDSMAAD
jgi:AraC family transcriptional regulator